ncbi:MAG: hypothetical protein RMJ98_02940 [Myxococcales bacterium]|nr:hypothetical protein [Polyangiaceae bacterium]MDW8248246.1 hypothetical protein [Myxococcales bacterium]
MLKRSKRPSPSTPCSERFGALRFVVGNLARYLRWPQHRAMLFFATLAFLGLVVADLRDFRLSRR